MGNDDYIIEIINQLRKKRRMHGVGLAGFSSLSVLFLIMALSNDNTALENILFISSIIGTNVEGRYFFKDGKGIKEYKSYIKDN